MGVEMRIASAFAVLVAGLAAPAQAQSPQCGPFPELRNALAKEHHEIELGGGIVNERAVMVVFVSPDGATWTMAILGTDGKACLIAHGVDWFQRPVPSSQERPS